MSSFNDTWTELQDESRPMSSPRVEIRANIYKGYTITYYAGRDRPETRNVDDFFYARQLAREILDHKRQFIALVEEERRKKMPIHVTPNETPEPPKETNLGKDSTSADEMAQIGEDELVAEELATDE